jgi:dipeptidase E
MPGTEFFTWPKQWVKQFLGTEAKRLLFIPFAGVTISLDDYASKVEEVFASIDYTISSIHKVDDMLSAIQQADAIVVGGGNTFVLLNTLYELKVLEAIQENVLKGKPYIGWSAGANLACPTVMTTNDMPVVEPPSLKALNLIPFQLNPHYHELKFAGQGGETRKERLEEFVSVNQDKKVLGLPEGMLVERIANNLTVHGDGIAKLYQYQKPVVDITSGEDVSYLLS